MAPRETGLVDHIGAFAVTAGIGTDELVRRFERDNDDYRAIIAKALADRLAEAFAELLHARVRREWGYGQDEHLSNEDLIAEKYRGIRPAFGYPACPDHTEKQKLFELLEAPAVGITLTEHFAMLPAASVSGIYLAHPQSRYFNLGRIGRDQVAGLRPPQGHDGRRDRTLALPQPRLRPRRPQRRLTVEVAFRLDLPHGRCVGVAIPDGSRAPSCSRRSTRRSGPSSRDCRPRARRPSRRGGRRCARPSPIWGCRWRRCCPRRGAGRGCRRGCWGRSATSGGWRWRWRRRRRRRQRALGVDLEEVRPFRIDISRRVLTPEEQAASASAARARAHARPCWPASA